MRSGSRSVLLALVLLIAALLVVSGCSLLTMRPVPDEPVPVTLRAAVEPARRALIAHWDRADRVRFRFTGARCATGAGVVMIFEQLTPPGPATGALAITHDVAAGVIAGAWQVRYDVDDPSAHPDLIALLGDREIACP